MKVLDKGFVEVVRVDGSDLDVVNAARVSFDKVSKRLTEGDRKLIKYLAENDHTSPFRHVGLSFRVKAPIIVAQQWWKYVVGSDHTMDAWNQESRRYVDDKPEVYIPDVWRGRAANNKQGSDAPLENRQQTFLRIKYKGRVEQAVKDYEHALEDGVAPEQARLFLPAYALYTTWIWTASLQSVVHFIRQRMDGHAQWEIQQYALAVKALTAECFPHSTEALTNDKAGEAQSVGRS